MRAGADTIFIIINRNVRVKVFATIVATNWHKQNREKKENTQKLTETVTISLESDGNKRKHIQFYKRNPHEYNLSEIKRLVKKRPQNANGKGDNEKINRLLRHHEKKKKLRKSSSKSYSTCDKDNTLDPF